jgi:hypothetical protein
MACHQKDASLVPMLQLEDGADDSNPLDEDLEEILDTVRALTNPWTGTEQQVKPLPHTGVACLAYLSFRLPNHDVPDSTRQARLDLGCACSCGGKCTRRMLML